MTGNSNAAAADFTNVSILEDVDFCIIGNTLNTKKRTFNKNLIFRFIMSKYESLNVSKVAMAATRIA